MAGAREKPNGTGVVVVSFLALLAPVVADLSSRASVPDDKNLKHFDVADGCHSDFAERKKRLAHRTFGRLGCSL